MPIQKPKNIEVEVYTEEMYDDILNEQGSIVISGLEFYPADILKNLDPIAYRTGLNDLQEYKDMWQCPICEDLHEDHHEALWCCQTEEEDNEE